jgi:sorbitol-specific phosphotransferase system component IIC
MKRLRKGHEMISRFKWTKLDWLIAIAIFLIILFVFAGKTGLADFVHGILHLLSVVLLWAGNALDVIGR